MISVIISRSLGNQYLFKVNNRKTRRRVKYVQIQQLKTTERCHGRRSGAFVVSF